MSNSLFALNLKVIRAKQRLIQLAERYGRQDHRVLAYSKRVDILVNKLQKEMTTV